MKIDVLTIFPEMFTPLEQSIIGRARQAGKLDVRVTDIRPFSKCKHKNTDDYPFGGGAGMLMMAQPILDAIRHVAPDPFPGKRILMSPRGRTLTQEMANELSRESNLLILCGHYEGVDERVVESAIDMEISIGDYVLTGGELPAMVLIDCLARQIEGVLGSEESAETESFSVPGLLEYPQYTRPRVFEGREVPEVLLSGDHSKINDWRRKQSILLTAQRRPDLLKTAQISEKEKAWLAENGYLLS